MSDNKDVALTVRITPEQRRQLQELAKQDKRSVSMYVRAWIEAEYKKKIEGK